MYSKQTELIMFCLLLLFSFFSVRRVPRVRGAFRDAGSRRPREALAVGREGGRAGGKGGGTVGTELAVVNEPKWSPVIHCLICPSGAEERSDGWLITAPPLSQWSGGRGEGGRGRAQR